MNRLVLLSDTQAIVEFGDPIHSEAAATLAAQISEALREGRVMVLAEPFEIDDRRPITVLSDLRRIEAKIDRLSEFSGWRSSDGHPLTVAEKAEVDRLNELAEARP